MTWAEDKAREILDDPRNFIRDEVAGYIPMHFNALYGIITAALEEAAEREREE